MKTIFVLAALAAFVSASSILANRGLKEDFYEFVDLVPVEKLTDLAVRYLLTDKEFQEFLAYLKEDEFSAAWDQFFAVPEVKEFLNYLQDAGLDVYDALNVVADFLGLNHIKPIIRSMRSGGVSGFVDEAVGLLPLEKLEKLFNGKLHSSVEFRAFFETLQKFNYHKLVELNNNSKEVQGFLNKLRGYGLDVDLFFSEVVKFIRSIILTI